METQAHEPKVKPGSSGIQRRNKRKNAARKRAQWEANHAERREINQARAHDVSKNPTYTGKNPYHPWNMTKNKKKG